MSTPSESDSARLRDLIVTIAESLVDRPDEVVVEEFEEDGAIVFELTVAEEDLGKVIGRQGRMVGAVRALLDLSGLKHDHRYILDVLD